MCCASSSAKGWRRTACLATDLSLQVRQFPSPKRSASASTPNSSDGRDRRQLERLCRYITRPPLALKRLSRRADGRLELELKSVWKGAGVTRCYTAEYDPVGNPILLTDPEGASVISYDEFDRVVEVRRQVDGQPDDVET